MLQLITIQISDAQIPILVLVLRLSTVFMVIIGANSTTPVPVVQYMYTECTVYGNFVPFVFVLQ